MNGEYELYTLLYNTYLLCMQSKERSSFEHAQQPRQQSRQQAAEETSPKQVNMSTASEEFDEQPGYSLRPAENRDMDEQQPDSLEYQDDRPQVECIDLESSETVELPFINDEVVPEDELDDDEKDVEEEKGPEQPDNTAKKKSELILQYTKFKSLVRRKSYMF